MNIYAAFTKILNKLMKVINKIVPSKEIRIKKNDQDYKKDYRIRGFCLERTYS